MSLLTAAALSALDRGREAMRANAPAKSSVCRVFSVQPGVQPPEGLGVSAVFVALRTTFSQPPELKVTGSIPVGSIE